MWQYIAEESKVLANLLKRQDIKELAEKLPVGEQLGDSHITVVKL